MRIAHRDRHPLIWPPSSSIRQNRAHRAALGTPEMAVIDQPILLAVMAGDIGHLQSRNMARPAQSGDLTAIEDQSIEWHCLRRMRSLETFV
jgi:hypothetical protein